MYTVTAEESVYSKGLHSSPPLNPSSSNPNTWRGREHGEQQAPCEWLLTCSRHATCYSNTFTGAKAGGYVKQSWRIHTHTHTHTLAVPVHTEPHPAKGTGRCGRASRWERRESASAVVCVWRLAASMLHKSVPSQVPAPVESLQ